MHYGRTTLRRPWLRSLLAPLLAGTLSASADVLVDSINTGTTTASFDIALGYTAGLPFRTDNQAYVLDSVELMMNMHVPAECVGHIFAADESHFPTGPILGSLTGPETFAQDPAYGVATFTADAPIPLAADSGYVFVLQVTTPDGAFHWQVERLDAPGVTNGSGSGPGFMPQVPVASGYYHIDPANAGWYDSTWGAGIWTWSGRVHVTPQPACEALGDWTDRVFSVAQAQDPDVSGPSVDVDGDGVSNLLEFAFDTDPLVRGPGISHQFVEDSGVNYRAVSFRRRICRENLTYTVEISPNLVAWNNGPGYVVEMPDPVDNGDGTEMVTVRSPTPDGGIRHEFFRLKVSYTGP